jgi:hypothetical protein
MPLPPRLPLLITASIMAVVLTASACGETTFDAPGFVQEVNSNGAELRLGDELLATADDREVFAVELAESGEAGAEEGHAHGGGSLTVTADADAALAEFERCESAVSLLCYRAANVVIAFEDVIAPEQLEPFEAAITKVGES